MNLKLQGKQTETRDFEHSFFSYPNQFIYQKWLFVRKLLSLTKKNLFQKVLFPRSIFMVNLENLLLTPLRQVRDTYVCVKRLRKRSILKKCHFDTFQNKIMLKKLKFYNFDIFPII